VAALMSLFSVTRAGNSKRLPRAWLGVNVVIVLQF